MRRSVLSIAALCLVSATAAAEEASGAAASETPSTRASIGLFAGVGGGGEDIYSTAITGGRVGAHITPRNWIMTSFGKGSFLFDDGYAQNGGGVWEAEVSFVHLRCNAGTVAVCFARTVGVGYQNGWAEFEDGLVMDDPWTETTSRLFVSARVGGRVVFDGHVTLELALGMRAMHSEYDAFLRGASATAALDAAF